MESNNNEKCNNVPSSLVPHMLRSRTGVQNTLSETGRTNDESQGDPVLATAPNKRTKWTDEEVKEVIWCFYNANARGRGSEEETFRIWRERNPELRPTFDAKRLATQRRFILSKGRLSTETLRSLRCSAENTMNRNSAPNGPNNTTLDVGLSAAEDENNGGNMIDEENEGSQLGGGTRERLRERLHNAIESTKLSSMESRLPLQKIFDNKRTEAIIRDVNAVLSEEFTGEEIELSITDINHILYASASVILEEVLGERKSYKGKQKPKQKEEPPWVRRIEARINENRRELSLIVEAGKHKRHGPKSTKKLEQVERKHQISDNTTRMLAVENLKQRIQAYAQRIRRYKKRTEFRIHNRAFEHDQKRFYQNIMGKKINRSDAPPLEEIETFWSSIWENEKHYDKNAEWIAAEQLFSLSIPKCSENEGMCTREDIVTVLKRLPNWKAPGVDKLQNFWMKRITSLHDQITRAVNRLLEDPNTIPQWMTCGITWLLPKDGDSKLAKNYRPITCLPVLYKLTTSVLADKIHRHLEERGLLPIEQKGCRKGSYGCKEILLMNKTIIDDARRKKKNLSMAWIDYKKAYDSVPHDWILDALSMYQIHPKLIKFCEISMNQWCTRLCLNNQHQTIQSRSIQIKRGIFQGDSLSPLLFCISLIPLSRILSDLNKGYKLYREERDVNHLLYMDDLKLYARNEKMLTEMISTVNIFSQSICMEFGLEKCAKINITRGKVSHRENINPDPEAIRDLEPGETYKYLGIEENSTTSNIHMKDKLRKEYFRRLRLILQTELTSRNKVMAINSLAVPVVEYSFCLVEWTEQEILNMDRRTRKLLTMHHMMHPKADVHRLYVSRQQGGRGLRQIEAVHRNSITNLARYVANKGDPMMKLITKYCKKNNCGIINQARRIIIRTKPHLEQLTDIELFDQYHSRVETQNGLHEMWQNKKLHGQYLKRIQRAGVDFKRTNMWLVKGSLKPETEAVIIAAQDQALKTRHYENRILKSAQSDNCRLCLGQSETVDHIVSACPVLAKHEYLERHNRVCSYIHWHMCKALNLPDTCEKWYDHAPLPVTTENHVTLLYDQQIRTDRTVSANKPDIVMRDISKKVCYIIDVSVPCDENVVTKYAEKQLKYKNLAIEIGRMWNMRTIIVPIIVGALGAIPGSLSSNLAKLPGMLKDWEVQEIALRGTAHILRKVL